MIKTDVVIPYRYNENTLKEKISEKLPVNSSEISEIQILKRSLDLSVGGEPKYKVQLAFSLDGEREKGILKIRKKASLYEKEHLLVTPSVFATRPVVVGFGPAGIFAALLLCEAGACPIILERGLDVDEREKKIKLFETLGILDTECNVQFGEGGAGTYSDGKLKFGAMNKYKEKIALEFISAGADEDISYSTTAHLGTDKLPGIIKNIREKIKALGADIIYGARLEKINIKDGKLFSVEYRKGSDTVTLEADSLILATGHSARDTVRYLYDLGMPLASKGFGIGMRIEHPREYINKIIYKDSLGQIEETASYHLVSHLASGRSVYSFCMCPGGSVVAATSTANGIVTNGMSEHARMGDNSNSALLVSFTPADFSSESPLSGIELQEKIERAAFGLTDSYKAPAIRLCDLVEKSKSLALGGVSPSYSRGVELIHPNEYMPSVVSESISEAMSDFDGWLSGFYYGDAVLTGPETRTTSPIRILRSEGLEVLGFSGIYAAGEGAGYAGGIVSSAEDGLKCAEALIEKYKKM